MTHRNRHCRPSAGGLITQLKLAPRLCVLLLSCAYPLHARPLDDKTLSPRVIEQGLQNMSFMLGISKSSRFYPKIKALYIQSINSSAYSAENKARRKQTEKVNRPAASGDSASAHQERSISLPDSPIIKHFRGSKGIPFPKKSELLEQMTNQMSALPQPGRTEQIDYSSFNPLEELANPSMAGLSVCRESKTIRLRLDQPPAGRLSSSLIFDILLMQPQSVPEATAELFGQSVVVVTVAPGVTSAEAFLINQFDLKCLPARVRASTNEVRVHYGLNALLNYDRSGKGSLHPSLNGLKRAYKDLSNETD